jgi:hypothetical protein
MRSIWTTLIRRYRAGRLKKVPERHEIKAKQESFSVSDVPCPSALLWGAYVVFRKPFLHAPVIPGKLLQQGAILTLYF